MRQRSTAALLGLVALVAVAGAFEPNLAKPRFREGSVFGGQFVGISRFDESGSGYNTQDGQYQSSLLHFDNTLNSWVTDVRGGDSIATVLPLPNGTIFFGTYSSIISGIPCNYIARYDPGVGVSCLGSGLNNYLTALAWANDELWVGGYFTEVQGPEYFGDNRFRYLAIWDGSRWKPAPYSGLNYAPNRLRVDNVGHVWAVGYNVGTTGDYDDKVLPLQVVPVHNVTTSCAACNSPHILVNGPANDNNNFIWGTLGQATVVVELGTGSTQLDGVRIRGTKLSQYDTTSFSVQCDQSGSNLNMRYWNPLTANYASTTQPSVFRTDAAPDYVDYLFTAGTLPSCKSLTFTFNAGTTFPKGVALTGIQVLRRRIYVDETYNPAGVTVTTSGNWTLENTETDDPNLVGYVQPGSPRSSIKFNPNIKVDGLYTMRIYFDTCPSNCLTTAEVLVDIPGRGAVTYPITVSHNSYTTLDLDFAPGSTIELLLPESSLSTDDKVMHFDRLEFRKIATISDLSNSQVVIYNPQDLTTVRRLGTPIPNGGQVYDVAFLGADAYLGGSFSYQPDDWTVSFSNVVRYSQGQFYPLPQGGLDSYVWVMETVDENTIVLAGGFRGPANTTLTSPRLNYVALLRDNAWVPLAGGSNETVWSIAVINKTEIFFVFDDYAGVFNDGYSQQNPVPTTILGHFSLTDNQWKLAPSLGWYPNGLAVSSKNELIVYTDWLEYSVDTTAHNLVSLQNGHWKALNGSVTGAYPHVYDKWVRTAVYYKDELIIGGDFSAAFIKDDQTESLACLARYNTTSKRWEPLQSRVAISCRVDDMLVVGDTLWIAGEYGVTSPTGNGRNRIPVTSGYLFAWNGTDFFMPTKPLPTTSAPSVVKLVAVNQLGRDYIIVAGTISGYCHNICVWDGENWHALGLGVSGPIYDVRVFGDYVVVGGSFIYAGGIRAPYIAKFDMGKGVWTPLESTLRGLDTNPVSNVNRIRGDSLNSLIIGGTFWNDYLDHYYAFARFDGEKFEYFGELDRWGDSYIRFIELVSADNLPSNHLLPNGKGLLATGQLYLADAVICQVALFDGVNWHPLLSAPKAPSDGLWYGSVRFFLEGPIVGLEAYQIALISVFSVIAFLLIIFLIILFLVILPKRRANKN